MAKHGFLGLFLILVAGLAPATHAAPVDPVRQTVLNTRIQNVLRILKRLDSCIAADSNHVVMYAEPFGCTVVTRQEVADWVWHETVTTMPEGTSPGDMAARINIVLGTVALQSKQTVAALRVVRGNMTKELDQTRRQLAALRAPPPPPRQLPPAPYPPPQPVGPRCPIGDWNNTIANGSFSVWSVHPDGSATESGLGNATGHATFNGATLHIEWTTGAWAGNYNIEIDPDCRKGTGTVVRHYGSGPWEAPAQTTFARR